MKNKITVTGVNIVFFAFLMLFFIFQIIIAIATIIYGQNFFDDKIYGILLVNQYVIILLPVLAYTLIKKLDIKEVFRVNKLRMIEAGIIILIAIPASMAANMLNVIVLYFLQYFGKVPVSTIPVAQNLKELLIGIAIVAISPAICEELLHRGLILKAYEKRGSVKALVISAIFFGIFHFDMMNLLGPIFLGLLIGYYVIRTNSIFAGMLAHFLNNFFAEILNFVNRENESTQKYISISLNELGQIIIIGIVSLFLVSLLLWAFTSVTENKAQYVPQISNVRNDIISVISHWPIIVIFIFYILTVVLFLVSIKYN